MDLEIKEYSDAPIKNIRTGEEYNITKKKKNLQNRGQLCRFMGKIQDTEGNEFADGLAFWSAEKAVQNFNNELSRYYFTVQAVEGSAAQMRLYSCKVLAAIMRKDAIKEVMKHRGNETVILVRGKVNEEQQQWFELVFLERHKLRR